MRLYVPNIKENTNGEAPEGEAAAAADEKTRAEVRHRANITLIPSSSKFFLILASYV
jgi:hypothetical protein